MRLLKRLSGICIVAVLAVTGTAWSYDASSPAAQFVVNYTDGAGYGFNDATLGSARKTALEYALSLWAAKLKGTETIIVNARCQNLGGSPTGAVLASAGPLSGASYPAPGVVPHVNTVYPVVLFNQYADQDVDTTNNDIQVTVNIDVDNGTVLGSVNFYYGTDANPGSHVDFVSVMLHELGHGLGFLTFMDQNGAMSGNMPDTYLRNLIQQPGGALMNMSNSGRQAAIISNALYWDGASLKNRYNPGTATSYGNVKMYAPGTYQSGSSVSHFDLSNFPNLLMEPQYSGADHGMDVTGNVLRDVGWFVDATALPVSLSAFTME